jgi:hypothetical protein
MLRTTPLLRSPYILLLAGSSALATGCGTSEGDGWLSSDPATTATSSNTADGVNPVNPQPAQVPTSVDEDGNVLDQNGDPILDEDGDPIKGSVVDGMVVDQEGNPVEPPPISPTSTGTSPSTSPSTSTTATVAPTNPPDPPDPQAELTDCSTPGPRIVRRLTIGQYYRTLQSIFNDSNVPKEDVLSNPSVLGFHVDAKAAVVRDLEGELLMNYAETVADWAVTNNKLGSFTSCSEQQEQCQKDFIAKLGAQAHREPLSDASVNAYLPLFAAEASFQDGQRAVVSAMLQSPYTLYRREMGTQQGNEYVLTPYEVASQLSYFLTDGPPDAQLYDAAAGNRLNTADGLKQEAERLLSSPNARETLSHFMDGWLEIDKLPSKAKDENILPFPDTLRASMVQETRELFLDLFYSGGTLAELFDANYTFVDQSLASHYGLNGGGGSSFQRTELSGTNRANGVLGQGAFLSAHSLSDNSSPVQRAKIVFERLICQTMPPVPQNLDTTLDKETTFKTNRERYEQHRNDDACRTCHEKIDPIGYAFENYDGFGRYRENENGTPVDASGEIAVLTSTGPVALDGVNSLSDVLKSSPEVEACLVRFWSYFAHGNENWSDYACHRDNVIRAAQGADFSLKSVLLGIVTSPNFTRRVGG